MQVWYLICPYVGGRGVVFLNEFTSPYKYPLFSLGRYHDFFRCQNYRWNASFGILGITVMMFIKLRGVLCCQTSMYSLVYCSKNKNVDRATKP